MKEPLVHLEVDLIAWRRVEGTDAPERPVSSENSF